MQNAKCKITDETVNDTVGTRLAVSVAGLNKNKSKENINNEHKNKRIKTLWLER